MSWSSCLLQPVLETCERRNPALFVFVDPAVVALIFAIGGGVLLGLLAYLVRTNAHLIAVDNGVAKWGIRHGSAFSTHGLKVATQFGSIYPIVVLCILLAIGETIRERSVWVVPF